MLKKVVTSICITLAVGVMYMPISVRAQALPKATAYAMQQSESFVYNKLKFDTISYDNAPKALTKEIDLYKDNKGFLYYIDKNSSDLYVAVMAGEKPTGGYGIKVNSVEDVEGRANILLEETIPDKDAILPQMVTYPYAIIKAQLPAFKISVKNSSGEVYSYLGSNGSDSDIVGASWTSGILKNIYTENNSKNNFIFIEIEDTFGKYQLFYASNTDEWKHKINNLKLDSTLSLQYALGTPEKYNEKSAFPLSQINLPVDKNLFTDKNFEELESYSDVSQDKKWTLTFKQEIKKENVNSSKIYVVDGDGTIIPTALSLSEDKKSVQVIPYKPYKLGKKYYLFVIKNLNGTNSSFKGYRMNFQITDSVPVK